MTLQIRWPFKPFNITQAWGVFNPAYKALGFTNHNGIDATSRPDPTYGQTWPVYCPVENFRVEFVSYEANGGGNQISLVSLDPVLMGDKTCYARLFLCHGKKILVKEGDMPVLGELLMVANNTGFSTGPHTHMGLYRIDGSGQKLDTNNATGSCDPAVYFTNTYAVDEATVPTLVKSGLRLAAYYLGIA